MRDNSLPLDTVMNEPQKDAFLKEVKDEYHGSPDQKRRQAADKAENKSVQAGKRQRWSRECQRRAGTTQMFTLLSFSGRWDPAFFAKEPVPQQKGETAEEKKKKTHAAADARARLRLAKKYEQMLARPQKSFSSRRDPEQQRLVAKLRDGTLQAEANRLTFLSGHGRIKRKDGTSLDIGGSTGGFTRCILYDWTPPNLDDEVQ